MNTRAITTLILLFQFLVAPLASADDDSDPIPPCVHRIRLMRDAWEAGGDAHDYVQAEWRSSHCENMGDPNFIHNVNVKLGRITEAGSRCEACEIARLKREAQQAADEQVDAARREARAIREAAELEADQDFRRRHPDDQGGPGGIGSMFSNPMMMGMIGLGVGGLLGSLLGGNSNQAPPWQQGALMQRPGLPMFARPGMGFQGQTGLPFSYPAPGGGYGSGIYNGAAGSGFGYGTPGGFGGYGSSVYNGGAFGLGGANIYNGSFGSAPPILPYNH